MFLILRPSHIVLLLLIIFILLGFQFAVTKIHFDILVPPQIVAFDFGEETVNSGDMLSVICTVNKGDFPLTILWTLNNRSVENLNGITILRTNKRVSQLSIDDVQANHAGLYICQAQNSAGTAFHQAELRVNGPFCKLFLFQ